MNIEELKKTLVDDGLFRSDGGLNTAWLHNRAKNYDFSELEGNTIQEKLYPLFHERKNCVICGKPTPFLSWSYGFLSTCCRECKREFDRRTLAEKAVPKVQGKEAKEKRARTNLEKYGVDNPFKSERVKERIIQTNLEKYGVERPAQNEKVVAKMEATNKKNHGGQWNTQTKEHRKRLIESQEETINLFEEENDCTETQKLIEKYGQGLYNLDLPQLSKGRYRFIENKYIPLIEKHYQETISNITHAEVEIIDFIREILPGEEILHNSRKIVKSKEGTSLEIDVYIPNKKVAIEYNGIYWHSAYDKMYHLYKTNECEKQEIRLIHIWEDLWIHKKEIYKSIISSALGIYKEKIPARKCEVRDISKKEYEDFLEKNHLQGTVHSSKMLGLFYKGTLVQVAGWGKSRFKKGEIELHRMSTLLNTQVIGGFSKLVKHSGIKEFISYVDRSLYNGKGYVSTGFQFLDYTPPSYFYSNAGGKRINRISAQKHKLPKLLKKFDASLTELQNMNNNHYWRIYDCGNIKMKYVEK